MSGIASDKPDCPACMATVANYAFTKDDHALFRCGNCGFLFVHPYPTAPEVSAYYAQRYNFVRPDFYPKIRSRRYRAFWRSLRFLRYVRGRAVLEIGCGGGFMVNAFAQLGAKAVGVDVSASSIEFARNSFPGGTFYCEPIGQFGERGLTFDFIFSSEVFEHLAGTADVMGAIAAAAKPGGYVYVSAPDLSHAAVPADIRQWPEISPPEHLQFFTRDALIACFRRYGFDLYREFPHKKPAHDRIFVRTR